MFFQRCNTPGEIKTRYRTLAKEHHPDIGGDTSTMQKINAAYHTLLEKLDGFTSAGSDGEQHTYKYNQTVEQAIMDKVMELLALAQPNLEIEVIGLWVWVSGSRKDQRDLLNRNGAGLKWHNKRQRWYWKPYKGRTRYNKSATFSDLRNSYGSQQFEYSDTTVTN